MPCIVCEKSDQETKYKCPKCGSRYCSVVCFKTHKETCLEINKPEHKNEEKAAEPQSILPANPQFDEILANEKVQELLRYEAVEKHLALIIQILNDPKLSGEQSQEGRRFVALKKIRELRKGGREANAAIEELAVTVTQIHNSKTG